MQNVTRTGLHRNRRRLTPLRRFERSPLRVRETGSPAGRLPAAAAVAGVFWVAATPAALAQSGTPASELRMWPTLLAILMAASVLERGIELLWNYLEWLLLNFRHWTPATVRAAGYTQFKSGTSLLLAIIAGILLANLLALRLFAALEPFAPVLLGSVPDTWDALLTGLVIGATTKPVHDLIGILAHVRGYLGNNAIKQREVAGAALADGVLKMAQSDAQTMIDVPGVGPTRLSTPMGDGAEEGEDASAAATAETYIDVLHRRTAL